MTNRTEELKKQGAEVRGNNNEEGSPFVRWPEEPAYVEGEVIDVWNSKHGAVVTVKVAQSSDNLSIDAESVNVGLSHKMLEDAIRHSDIGGVFHIAFDGWGKSKSSGNRYRLFTVLCISPSKQPVDVTTNNDKPFETDDELPF